MFCSVYRLALAHYCSQYLQGNHQRFNEITLPVKSINRFITLPAEEIPKPSVSLSMAFFSVFIIIQPLPTLHDTLCRNELTQCTLHSFPSDRSRITTPGSFLWCLGIPDVHIFFLLILLPLHPLLNLLYHPNAFLYLAFSCLVGWWLICLLWSHCL